MEAYVQQIACEAARNRRAGLPCRRTPAEAVAHLREIRKGVTLGGLKIKDLINESRKY